MKKYLALACLSIYVSAFHLKKAFAQDDTHSTGTATDVLDDQAEVQYQEAINNVLSTYDPQISSIKSQIQDLSTSGKQQCIQATREAISQADAGASAASAQAMQNMLEPGTETVGHALDSVMGGAGSEKSTKEAQLQKMINTCQGTGVLDCDKNGAEPMLSTTGCATAGYPDQGQCRQYASSEASRYTSKITALSSEINELDSGMGELLGSGIQLAVAGLTGNMLKKQAAEQAAGMKANASEAEKLCDLQVNNQIAALQSSLSNLEAQKARDLTMARVSAEYGTRNRRKQADILNTNEEDLPPGSIAVGDPLVTDLPGSNDEPFSKLFGNKGGGAGTGGGGGGGSAGGGGAGEPDFGAFGGGGGDYSGGSPLPPQTDAGSAWSGTAASAANEKDGGGFGNGFSEFKEKEEVAEGDRSPAGIEAIGDGGIRVLLARTTIVHSKHASILLKSLDFDKLAKRSKENGREAASVTNSMK